MVRSWGIWLRFLQELECVLFLYFILKILQNHIGQLMYIMYYIMYYIVLCM